METPLEERVAYVRRRLATAFDHDAVLLALSRADLDVLRAIEMDYTVLPGPAGTLRTRIARSHAALVRAQAPRNTGRVGANDVVGWAQDVLALFLSGVSDPLPDKGGQYRVELVTAPPHPGAAAVYQVSTLQGHDPRRFLVAVGVREIQA